MNDSYKSLLHSHQQQQPQSQPKQQTLIQKQYHRNIGQWHTSNVHPERHSNVPSSNINTNKNTKSNADINNKGKEMNAIVYQHKIQIPQPIRKEMKSKRNPRKRRKRISKNKSMSKLTEDLRISKIENESLHLRFETQSKMNKKCSKIYIETINELNDDKMQLKKKLKQSEARFEKLVQMLKNYQKRNKKKQYSNGKSNEYIIDANVVRNYDKNISNILEHSMLEMKTMQQLSTDLYQDMKHLESENKEIKSNSHLNSVANESIIVIEESKEKCRDICVVIDEQMDVKNNSCGRKGNVFNENLFLVDSGLSSDICIDSSNDSDIVVLHS